MVDPEKAKITCIDTKHEPLHPYFDLFVVHYLLGCREMQPVGQAQKRQSLSLIMQDRAVESD